MDHCHNHVIITLIPASVLAASFLGSWHCVGMCGGLIIASTKNKTDIALYHLGRLIGYLALGMLISQVGEIFFTSLSPLFTKLGIVMIGTYLVYLGITLFISPQKALHTGPSWFTKPLHYIFKSTDSPRKSFLIGLCSILLPCGWLYAFLAATLTLHSLPQAMIMMTLFWLGTLPALLASPMLIQKVLRPIRTTLPKLSALILILAGIITILLKILY